MVSNLLVASRDLDDANAMVAGKWTGQALQMLFFPKHALLIDKASPRVGIKQSSWVAVHAALQPSMNFAVLLGRCAALSAS